MEERRHWEREEEGEETEKKKESNVATGNQN